MSDMTAVIAPKSDQLNTDDLIAGPRTIRIREVRVSPGTEQPVSIYFDGDGGKPWRPCKSMSRLLVGMWGPDSSAYVGKSLTLYRDPKVTWGGMEVGGIRISNASHIESSVKMALTATRGKKAVATVQPLSADVIDPAAKWTADFIGKIAATTSLDELKALETMPDNVAAIAKLQAKRPKLHEQIAKAIANIADGFVSQATHGEQTTLVDALDALTRADTREDVDAIVNGHADLSDEDTDKLRSAAMERIGEIEA